MLTMSDLCSLTHFKMKSQRQLFIANNELFFLSRCVKIQREELEVA